MCLRLQKETDEDTSSVCHSPVHTIALQDPENCFCCWLLVLLSRPGYGYGGTVLFFVRMSCVVGGRTHAHMVWFLHWFCITHIFCNLFGGRFASLVADDFRDHGQYYWYIRCTRHRPPANLSHGGWPTGPSCIISVASIVIRHP